MLEIVNDFCREKKITKVEDFRRKFEEFIFCDEEKTEWSENLKGWFRGWEKEQRVLFFKALSTAEIEQNLYREKGEEKHCAKIFVHNQLKNYGEVDSDYVWYACYGSNLDEERFSYYIRGGWYEKTQKEYVGCADTSHWVDECFMKIPGKMYFAKESSSWKNKGVAFYYPEGDGFTYMKLYKIKKSQLTDVQVQECISGERIDNKTEEDILDQIKNRWYGKRICLGVLDGCPIYTITNATKLEENEPSDKYLDVIRGALLKQLGIDNGKRIEDYIRICLPKN